MSHHISNNDPKHGSCDCGCHQQDLNPSRLDQVIAQYEAMTKEAEAAKERFIQAAMGFDIHLESFTDEEIYEMFNRNNH